MMMMGGGDGGGGGGGGGGDYNENDGLATIYSVCYATDFICPIKTSALLHSA